MLELKRGNLLLGREKLNLEIQVLRQKMQAETQRSSISQRRQIHLKHATDTPASVITAV